MLMGVLFVVEQLINGSFELNKPLLRFGIGKVDGLVGPGSGNVESRLEDIDARYHSTKPRHGKFHVAFVLASSVLTINK